MQEMSASTVSLARKTRTDRYIAYASQNGNLLPRAQSCSQREGGRYRLPWMERKRFRSRNDRYDKILVDIWRYHSGFITLD